MNHKVYSAKISDFNYRPETFIPVIKEGIDRVFDPGYFKSGEKVLLKPSLLMEHKKGGAITTNKDKAERREYPRKWQ